jgi:hypothetical protein
MGQQNGSPCASPWAHNLPGSLLLEASPVCCLRTAGHHSLLDS